MLQSRPVIRCCLQLTHSSGFNLNHHTKPKQAPAGYLFSLRMHWSNLDTSGEARPGLLSLLAAFLVRRSLPARPRGGVALWALLHSQEEWALCSAPPFPHVGPYLSRALLEKPYFVGREQWE